MIDKQRSGGAQSLEDGFRIYTYSPHTRKAFDGKHAMTLVLAVHDFRDSQPKSRYLHRPPIAHQSPARWTRCHVKLSAGVGLADSSSVGRSTTATQTWMFSDCLVKSRCKPRWSVHCHALTLCRLASVRLSQPCCCASLLPSSGNNS